MRWLPVALLMASCAVGVHGRKNAMPPPAGPPEESFFPLRAQEKIEQQHEQQEQRKQELEKQFGEVLTNNQVPPALCPASLRAENRSHTTQPLLAALRSNPQSPAWVHQQALRRCDWRRPISEMSAASRHVPSG